MTKGLTICLGKLSVPDSIELLRSDAGVDAVYGAGCGDWGSIWPALLQDGYAGLDGLNQPECCTKMVFPGFLTQWSAWPTRDNKMSAGTTKSERSTPRA